MSKQNVFELTPKTSTDESIDQQPTYKDNVIPFRIAEEPNGSLFIGDLDKISQLEQRGMTRELGALTQGAIEEIEDTAEMDQIINRHLGIIAAHADRKGVATVTTLPEKKPEPQQAIIINFPT